MLRSMPVSLQTMGEEQSSEDILLAEPTGTREDISPRLDIRQGLPA